MNVSPERGSVTPPVVEARATVSAGEFSIAVNVDVPSGITVLFGPSGSGKSLTLATIAGLRRPVAGRISIGGETVADVAAGLHMRTQNRRIGMVFQDALLLPHRTAMDNVALAVRSGSRQARRHRAGEMLDMVGAGSLGRASPTRLSGGERQRVALARALAGGPAVLLLDEPFSALDHSTRLVFRSLLRTVTNTTGVPVLLVTHDLDEAAELADQTIHFANGTTASAVPGFSLPGPGPMTTRLVT